MTIRKMIKHIWRVWITAAHILHSHNDSLHVNRLMKWPNRTSFRQPETAEADCRPNSTTKRPVTMLSCLEPWIQSRETAARDGFYFSAAARRDSLRPTITAQTDASWFCVVRDVIPGRGNRHKNYWSRMKMHISSHSSDLKEVLSLLKLVAPLDQRDNNQSRKLGK